jgi:catechol 2,3-dioxygenase-like lactoylglutathione lyase family enzyme
MVKFDHMAMPVSNPKVSRDWYVKNFGFEVEFENAGVIAIPLFGILGAALAHHAEKHASLAPAIG